MKQRRFKRSYRNSASELHKIVGEALKRGPFAGCRVYQEYPVTEINPDYHSNRHKFDWVIVDHGLVIEVMGEQHFGPVTFGGISKDEAIINYHNQVIRDEIKKEAALDAGWTYITVPYWDHDKVDEYYLFHLYTSNFNTKSRVTSKCAHCVGESRYEQQTKDRARQYRKDRYQRQKVYFKQLRKERANDKKTD